MSSMIWGNAVVYVLTHGNHPADEPKLHSLGEYFTHRNYGDDKTRLDSRQGQISESFVSTLILLIPKTNFNQTAQITNLQVWLDVCLGFLHITSF